MGKTRAAVVLFVDMDEEDCSESRDIADFVRQGLYQAGYGLHKAPLLITFQGKIVQARIVDVMDVGMAMGNGYLWSNVTHKAYSQRGIYTEAQQAQIDEEAKWENEKDGNT